VVPFFMARGRGHPHQADAIARMGDAVAPVMVALRKALGAVLRLLSRLTLW